MIAKVMISARYLSATCLSTGSRPLPSGRPARHVCIWASRRNGTCWNRRRCGSICTPLAPCPDYTASTNLIQAKSVCLADTPYIPSLEGRGHTAFFGKRRQPWHTFRLTSGKRLCLWDETRPARHMPAGRLSGLLMSIPLPTGKKISACVLGDRC
jgi:hypothetical protein